MKSFGLLIAAIFLFIILAPIGFFWHLISRKSRNAYLFKIALSIDQSGNVVCAELFNAILITSAGYKFGNEDETISSVLGRNKEMGTLTKTGIKLASFLDAIDENHVEDAVGH